MSDEEKEAAIMEKEKAQKSKQEESTEEEKLATPDKISIISDRLNTGTIIIILES